jgi:hypothetical protein
MNPKVIEGLKRYRAEVASGLRPKPERRSDGTVKRRVRCESNLVRFRELVVTVYPHGELGLRLARGKGRRVEYKVGMADVWRMAVQITTMKYAGKIREYKKVMTLKEARRRARKELGL